MKLNRSILLAFGLLVVSASLYRVWDTRPFGFTPQIAMAIFGGAIIKDKRWAFVLPILSLFISDLLYHVLYINGYTEIQGLYEGQGINYLLFAGLTVFGFALKKITALRVLGFSVAGSVLYFIVSNFTVWLAGAGLSRPKTADGLVLCYGHELAKDQDLKFVWVKGHADNKYNNRCDTLATEAADSRHLIPDEGYEREHG